MEIRNRTKQLLTQQVDNLQMQIQLKQKKAII